MRGFAIRAGQENVSGAEALVVRWAKGLASWAFWSTNAAAFVMAPVGGDVNAAAIERQNKINVNGVFATTPFRRSG